MFVTLYCPSTLFPQVIVDTTSVYNLPTKLGFSHILILYFHCLVISIHFLTSLRSLTHFNGFVPSWERRMNQLWIDLLQTGPAEKVQAFCRTLCKLNRAQQIRHSILDNSKADIQFTWSWQRRVWYLSNHASMKGILLPAFYITQRQAQGLDSSPLITPGKKMMLLPPWKLSQQDQPVAKVLPKCIPVVSCLCSQQEKS